MINKMFTAKPSTPRLLYPQYNEKNVTIFPKLQWAGSGSEKYYIYLGETPQLDSRHLVAERQQREYEPLPLDFNKTYYWRIEAASEGGSAFSEIGFFSTIENAIPYYPAEPLKVVEEIEPQGALFKAVLEWSSLRADYFNVSFGEDPNPGLFVSGSTDSHITIEGLNPNQTYYWRVEAVNAFQSVKSAVWSFDTPSMVLLPPEAVYPQNNADEIDTAVLLEWSKILCPLGGEVIYELYLSDSPSFSSENTMRESISQNYYLVGGLAYTTDYYWKVEAKSVSGQSQSEVFRFSTRQPTSQELPETPFQPTPADHTTISADSVSLFWECDRADRFELYLGTDSASLSLIASNIGTKSYSVETCLPGNGYYWKIIAHNQEGLTEGPVWTFHTSIPYPPKAEALYPKNADSDISLSPTFLWSVSPESIGSTVVYDFYLGETALLGEHEKIGFDLKNTNFSGVTLTEGAKYYWKVVSKNAYGSTESSVYYFQTVYNDPEELPSVPSSPSPSDNESDVKKNITLTWNSAYAENYHLWLGLSPENLVQIQSVLTVPVFQLTGLGANTQYYWKVIASNGFGFSEGPIWRFKTEADPLPAALNVFPSHGAAGLELTPTLVWTPVVSPSGESVTYELYLSENPADMGQFPIVKGLEHNEYRLNELERSTAYYWKVKAITDSAVSESGVFLFSTRGPTANELPEIPKMPVPASYAINVPVTLGLSWESGRAETFSLFIGTDPKHMSLIQSPLNASSFTIDSLNENTLYYWKVIAINAFGFTEGPIWVFETELNDQVAPEITHASLSLPYNPNGRMKVGNIGKLKLYLEAEDDVSLKSITLEFYYRKKGQSLWNLLSQQYEELNTAYFAIEREVYCDLSASPGGEFEEVGYYELYAKVASEDMTGKKSAPYSTGLIGIEIYEESQPEQYDIEGTWSGTFSISYIVFINGSISLNIVKTGSGLFSVDVVYEGKTYKGKGGFDSNGDLRISTTVEGLPILIIGSFDGPISVTGSVFIVGEGGVTNRIGSWQAKK